jgi:hypothetical protein
MSDYNNPFSQQKKKKALTVADVIGVQTNWTLFLLIPK